MLQTTVFKSTELSRLVKMVNGFLAELRYSDYVKSVQYSSYMDKKVLVHIAYITFVEEQ